MSTLTVVVLAVIVSFPMLGALAVLDAWIREPRVSSRIRVADLRKAFRQVEPGEQITVRPAASWILSVEMIMEVAADEGLWFVRDTITTADSSQARHKAIVLARGEHRD